jgi:MoaA/NifB/PqqE/SkfB family radical SAM enzyme
VSEALRFEGAAAGARHLPLRETSAFPVPWYLYLRLATSNVCNFRCKHCHIWMNRDPRNGLTTRRRIELIREFAQLRPGGIVEFPGGEVTLAFDELCALAGTCRDVGLAASIVTNGSNLQTPAAVERLLRSGLRGVTVSLDSHRPEVHDYLRGVAGAFELATTALRLLVAARHRLGNRTSAPTIQAIGVVFDRNAHELGEYVELCRSLGVDQVCLQVLNRTFDNHDASRDAFFEKHFWHTSDAKQRATAALREVLERYAEDPLLKPGPRDLPRLEGAILKAQGGSTAVPCAAHWRNVIVDTDGEVSLCFDHPHGAEARSIGNVERLGLADVLGSPAAAVMRKHMATCRKSCAELECHRAPVPPTEPPVSGERSARLEVDWAHRDVLPVALYRVGSKGRLLTMRGLGDNLRLLHLLRDGDHVICFTNGDYQEPAYEMMRRVCEVFAFDVERLSVLCNYPAQLAMARRAGLTAHFCNANAFIDENVFRPVPMHKAFDAVSNARLIGSKRVRLANQVRSLAIIRGHRLESGDYDDPATIPHLYINEGPLSPRGVVRVLCASHVGLALSEAEGACLASSEYLLCGLPVVSTPSRGGRDVWYDENNSLICEPTPEGVSSAVRSLVARLQRGELDPSRIRAGHLAEAAAHRRRFVELTTRVFAQIGAADDAAQVFAAAFASPGILPPYKPYAELERALSTT